MATAVRKRPATDSDVARAMGFDKAAVSRVVNGQRPPGREFMDAVSKALGWSLRSQHIAVAEDNYAEKFRERITKMQVPVDPPDAA